MIDITKYNSFISADINNIVYPVNFVPNPVKAEYDLGKTSRYFVKKINSGEISEVSKNNFNDVSDILYTKVFLTWYISGPKNNIKQGYVVINKGVTESNKESIATAEQSMKGIKNYLTDYLQFYK